MCCRSEWQDRMYIYKWHEVDQTKHEIFCVHIVCNEIQVKVNLEITTFFFYLRFPYCPNFFWFGVVHRCILYDNNIHIIYAYFFLFSFSLVSFWFCVFLWIFLWILWKNHLGALSVRLYTVKFLHSSSIQNMKYTENLNLLENINILPSFVITIT